MRWYWEKTKNDYDAEIWPDSLVEAEHLTACYLGYCEVVRLHDGIQSSIGRADCPHG